MNDTAIAPERTRPDRTDARWLRLLRAELDRKSVV